MDDKLVRYTLRVDRFLFKKFRYIAESEGRSANKEIEQYLKKRVAQFEEENGKIEINIINIRDFSKDKHKKVDDTPYGGGAGMVIRPDVVYDAYCSIKNKENATSVR